MIEPDFVRTTRASYDTVAVNYAELLDGQLQNKPFDRAMLTAFADVVKAADGGPVAELGCGPGLITAHLHSLGLAIRGIDLSPKMVAVARQRHPELQFDEGSMLDLDLPDESLRGVLAWYSIIHTPPEQLPVMFAEFHRVLAPGGHLMIAFKVGDELRHLAQGYGHEISLDVYWLSPDRVAELASHTGMVEVGRLVRRADPDEKGPQGFFLARKPGKA
ncbi:methyltransferase domain-containing protein [Solihabitans fulvus]|uniref:Methyltransferase domain-containing protein n=1 Tax=Solihabitans fulvus TaxID=1892852 RepID=A0A5B2XS07_9PSEU|nr:class I SAM-dependent methyltransferase [Solihabitans fulvus]KAA2265750.1 methyltransferase domain-containing protein [Solihabitans fulvus]